MGRPGAHGVQDLDDARGRRARRYCRFTDQVPVRGVPSLLVPVRVPTILLPVTVPLMVAVADSCMVTLVPLTVPVTENGTTSSITALVQFGSAGQPAGKISRVVRVMFPE